MRRRWKIARRRFADWVWYSFAVPTGSVRMPAHPRRKGH